MGKVPAAQLWALLNPLRSFKMAKNTQKTKVPKAPAAFTEGRVRGAGLGSPAAQLSAPHHPAPGEQPSCALPDPLHCLAKGEENPSACFLVVEGGKIKIWEGSPVPQNPAIPAGGAGEELGAGAGNPARLPPGSGGERRPALPSRGRLGMGQRWRGRAGGGAGGLLPPLPGRRRRKKRGAPGRFQPATILCGGLKQDGEEEEKI